MDSYPFRLTDGLCSLSPNGLYAASCYCQRTTIYSIMKSRQCNSFHSIQNVEQIEWSPDSELILTAYLSIGEFEVWSINNQEWHCKTVTGSPGLQAALFSPNSRNILTISFLHLRLTIWSLTDHVVWHLNLPKLANPTVDFSLGGTHMAVAQRRSAKDCVGIYACDSWTEVTVIQCETLDLSGVKWSPDGSKLAVWDSVGNGKLAIYSVSGSKLAEVPQVFGIHNVLWSPTAQVLIAATAGSKVKLVNHLTWQSITCFRHVNVVREAQPCIAYKEAENGTEYLAIRERPLALLNNAPCGMVCMSASHDGRFLATLDRDQPKVVWVWDIPSLRLTAVLIQRHPVKCFNWSPKGPRLAIACGTTSAYVWTPTGCAVIDLSSSDASAGLRAEKIEWHNSCHFVMVSNKELGCVFKLDVNA